MTRKTCGSCQKRKSIDSFKTDQRSKDGHVDVCMQCNIDAGTPWKNYSQQGAVLLQCPCKHAECQGMIKQCTIYRHLKYGISYRWPCRVKAKNNWQYDSDSD